MNNNNNNDEGHSYAWRFFLLTSAHKLPVETEVILVPGPPGYTALPAGLCP